MMDESGFMKTGRSQRQFIRANRFLVGGVNSPVRAFKQVNGLPVFIARGKGSKIYDIDGNEYIDYVCSWGALILGHSHPKVLAAAKNALYKGSSFGAPTEAEIELAEIICRAVESIDKVRFVSSGTEAVMTAIRLARAFTGRQYILKMAGCYHGHSDSMLVCAGSGAAHLSRPSSAGVLKALADKTLVVDYNDAESAERVFDRYRNRIAACIVEPVAANMGVVLPRAGYLQTLRRLCSENGALLIFDEVITGFRLCFGGAGRIFKVAADLVCLGKIIGGGFPLAAVGGRADVMNLLAPCGSVYQAGTLSGNPVAVAAALAALKVLKNKTFYSKLEEKSNRLQTGLIDAAKKTAVPLTVNRIGSLMSCFFTEKAVYNLEDVRKTNLNAFKIFFKEMLKQGIYLAPSAYEAMFVSAAHTKNDIEKTIFAAENSLKRIKDCI